MKIQDLRRLLAGNLDVEQYQVEWLLDKLTPVLVLDTLIAGEDAGNIRICGGAFGVSPVAAKGGRLHLQNPAGSGVKVEVLEAWVSTGDNSVCVIGFSETELGTSAYLSVLNRYAGTVAAPAKPAATLTYDTDAASGITAADIFWNHYLASAGNQPTRVPIDGVVLQPGTGVRIFNSTVNKPLYGSFRWRETLEK